MIYSMKISEEKRERLLREIKFHTSRSSGPGGQNVNKVSTKVELLFKVNESELFDDKEKYLINTKLRNRINFEGVLRVEVQQTRSQLKNKEIAIEHFYELLEQSLVVPKKRKPTKPSKQAKLRRLQSKKMNSEKKARRRFDY